MKAFRLLEYGGRLVFNDVPTPAITRDEILVKIRVPPSIIWILSRPPERQDRYFRSTCRGYLVMSFQGSSNRLAVTLRHMRQVMPCLLPTRRAARTRSIWLSSRRPSQGNHPTSHLRRQHLCRWPPKLRGRDSSPTVTWKRDKRS